MRSGRRRITNASLNHETRKTVWWFSYKRNYLDLDSNGKKPRLSGTSPFVDALRFASLRADGAAPESREPDWERKKKTSKRVEQARGTVEPAR